MLCIPMCSRVVGSLSRDRSCLWVPDAGRQNRLLVLRPAVPDVAAVFAIKSVPETLSIDMISLFRRPEASSFTSESLPARCHSLEAI